MKSLEGSFFPGLGKGSAGLEAGALDPCTGWLYDLGESDRLWSCFPGSMGRGVEYPSFQSSSLQCPL